MFNWEKSVFKRDIGYHLHMFVFYTRTCIETTVKEHDSIKSFTSDQGCFEIRDSQWSFLLLKFLCGNENMMITYTILIIDQSMIRQKLVILSNALLWFKWRYKWIKIFFFNICRINFKLILFRLRFTI